MSEHLPVRRPASEASRLPSPPPQPVEPRPEVERHRAPGPLAGGADERQLTASSLTIGQIHAQQVSIVVNNTTVREETRVQYVQQTDVRPRYQTVDTPPPAPRSDPGREVAGVVGCLAVAVLAFAAVAFLVGWGWHALTSSPAPAAHPAPAVRVEIGLPAPRTFDEFLRQHEGEGRPERE